jgi:4,5-DOPA dioxygenase extradiol
MNGHRVSRRALIGGAAALAAGTVARRARAAPPTPMPVGLVSHGSPMLLIDPVRGPALRAWGRELPKPIGIVSMTPHYAARRLRLGATGRGFGMYNFPRWLARNVPDRDYPSPSSPALARRVRALLSGMPVLADASRRGFDHTTWMPLYHLFPAADVPVVELTYPYVSDADHFALGRRLAALRDEGVFFMASGGMTHNLASIDLDHEVPVPLWSSAFDAWAAERLSALDVDALLDWRHKAPDADLAHPDDGGHFRVFLVGLGVALGARTPARHVRFPYVGYESTLSVRCTELA